MQDDDEEIVEFKFSRNSHDSGLASLIQSDREMAIIHEKLKELVKALPMITHIGKNINTTGFYITGDVGPITFERMAQKCVERISQRIGVRYHEHIKDDTVVDEEQPPVVVEPIIYEEPLPPFEPIDDGDFELV